MIEAVCIDVGGVLLFPPPEAAWAVLGRRGPVEPDVHRRAHYAGMIAYDRTGGDWSAYLEGFCRGYGLVGPDLASAVTALRETLIATPWSTVFEESVEGLRSLASTGVKLAIVSNSDGTAERQLATLGVCQVGPGRGVLVAMVVDSQVVGVAKPDPAIFTFALDAAGVAAANAVHVGDCVHADVEGARAAGMRPLHFDPLGLCDDRDHEHVARLRDVAALVEGATHG